MLLLAAGCARAPALRSAAEARARLLESSRAETASARGEGTVTWVRNGKRLGSADVRWVSAGESVAVVASVGPVRGLAASLRGDSLAVALRHSGLFVSGALDGKEGSDARFLRFLVEPWRLGTGWAREALARAAAEPCEGGYCLIGAPEDDPGRTLRLVVSPRAEPVSLSVRVSPDAGDRIEVRYGRPRRFAAGRLPRWVEWIWRRSRARLSIEAHSAARPGVRFAFRPGPGDTLYTLDDPGGRAVLRALFGYPAREEAP